MKLEQIKLHLVEKKIIYPTEDDIQLHPTFLGKIMHNIEKLREKQFSENLFIKAFGMTLLQALGENVSKEKFRIMFGYLQQRFFNSRAFQDTLNKVQGMV